MEVNNDKEREQALETIVMGIGQLLAVEMSRLDTEAAVMTCQALELQLAKVRCEIELAPLALKLSVVREGHAVDICEVHGGFDKFAFAQKGTKTN